MRRRGERKEKGERPVRVDGGEGGRDAVGECGRGEEEGNWVGDWRHVR